MRNPMTIVRNLAAVVVVCAVATVGLIGNTPRAAEAATFTVTSLADDGTNGTLRWAITQANATAGTDVINFDNALAGTIILTSNLPNITESVTINGPGEDDLVIDGAGSYRPFWITSQGEVLTLSDITLRRGGGGGDSQLIFNSRAVVVATRVTFKDTPGVAVFNKEAYSVATYTDCSFLDNGEGIGGDHGSTPSAVSNTDTDYQNRTYVVDSLFEDNGTAISQERFTKVTGSVFRNNGTAASIRGLNRTQILNSTFTGNIVAVYHNNWTPTNWTSVGTNNRFHNGNTFTNNTVAFALSDYWNDGRQSQQWTTITNNAWDGLGTWIEAGRWDGTTNVTDTVTSLNSAGREWVESNNSILSAPTAPTTTTTTTTSTVPPGTTVAPSPNSTPSQSGTGGAASSPAAGSTPSAPIAAAGSTTTTSTTTTIPAPEAPDTSTGSGAMVDGREVETTLTRADNALVVSAAGIEATVYGLATDGRRIGLDADGMLRLAESDRIVVEAQGYMADASVEVWIYSTPKRLGELTVNSTGTIEGSFVVPPGIESGDHRVVIDGQNGRGQDVVLGIGIAIGSVEPTSLVARLLIIIPVSVAVLVALIIPTRLRRRRVERTVG